MARRKSKYVCKLCGLPVHVWGTKSGWKHSAGFYTESCGRPPVPIEREQYDKELRDIIEGVREQFPWAKRKVIT
jgi:hypothetical protein